MYGLLSTLSSFSTLQLATLVGAVSAAVGSGMMYVFSTGVMPGLGRLPQAEAMRAMQAINVAVINPLFLGVFMGTGLFLALLAGWNLIGGAATNPWLVAGAVVYMLGVVLVTIGGNVRLNDALATMDPGTAPPCSWSQYAQPWLRWNHLRALAAALSSGLLILGVAA
jgi:uncharacterized membrane protein